MVLKNTIMGLNFMFSQFIQLCLYLIISLELWTEINILNSRSLLKANISFFSWDSNLSKLSESYGFYFLG